MQRVFKYPLKVADEQYVKMPSGAQILSVQLQRSQICLWALVNDENPESFRKILMRGTGHAVEEVGRYVSTFQMNNGGLVFHVFEGQ